jgi:hypothetical protein
MFTYSGIAPGTHRAVSARIGMWGRAAGVVNPLDFTGILIDRRGNPITSISSILE